MRDNMEQHIIQKYKKIYPQFEMESSALRVPNFANVVIYSNVTSADDFINKYLHPDSASSPFSV